MASQYPDVITPIKTWLSMNHKKIESFWVGAEWEKWARYEMFMALESSHGSDCVVTHSMSELWQEGDNEVDVLVEPREGSQTAIAIRLVCENVSENEGSFERFRDRVDADATKIKSLGAVQSSFEGTRLLLIGFGGEPMGEDTQFQTQPQPQHFECGEVHCWIIQHDLKPAE